MSDGFLTEEASPNERIQNYKQTWIDAAERRAEREANRARRKANRQMNQQHRQSARKADRDSTKKKVKGFLSDLVNPEPDNIELSQDDYNYVNKKAKDMFDKSLSNLSAEEAQTLANSDMVTAGILALNHDPESYTLDQPGALKRISGVSDVAKDWNLLADDKQFGILPTEQQAIAITYRNQGGNGKLFWDASNQQLYILEDEEE